MSRSLIAHSIVALFCWAACSSCTRPEQQSTGTRHAGAPAEAAVVCTVKVAEKRLSRTMRIPAELRAFREVLIYPKVQGYVSSMLVDRGSAVKDGAVMATIVAPELEAAYSEAQAKLETARAAVQENDAKIESLLARCDEAQSKLESVEASFNRIKTAADTAGAIAPVDLESAQKEVQAAHAHLRASHSLAAAARSERQTAIGRVKIAEQALSSVRETMAYLTVRAPFAAVVSERHVHEGSLVGGANSQPLLKLQQISKLRLIVPVPEAAIAGVKCGTPVRFHVCAYVGKEFQGVVARVSHQVERKTRTMIVETDVDNSRHELEPGMFAEVLWTMQRPENTLFVPATAVGSDENRHFVIVFKNASTRSVPVVPGQNMGAFVEIAGDLRAGDEIALYANRDYPAVNCTRALLSEEELLSRLNESGH